MLMRHNRSLLLGLALVAGALWWAVPAGTQGISVPNTFSNNTVADADEVNANFAALAAGALNRAGGTLTGALNLNGQTLTGAATASGAWTFSGAVTASGAWDFTSGVTVTSGQIKFPAVQVPSADPNMFDDYQEESWTPVLTFETPGNLAVTYAAQVGRYVKKGSEVTVWGTVETSAFTHTTAAGDLRITGLPATSLTVAGLETVGTMAFQGITKAGYTQFVPVVQSNVDRVRFMASGTGASLSAVSAANVPSGGTVVLQFTVTYRAAN